MRLFFYICIIALAGCKEPEARRPLQVKTKTFFDESVARNQRLLALETESIKKFIARDTLHTYRPSASGFWYAYRVRDSVNTYTPGTDDLVLITYDIRTLYNDTLYSEKQIGKVHLKIDREIIFPGLNKGIKLMKKGETVTFLFPSFLAYGYHGDERKIGVNMPLISTVTLLDIIEKQNHTNSN